MKNWALMLFSILFSLTCVQNFLSSSLSLYTSKFIVSTKLPCRKVLMFILSSAFHRTRSLSVSQGKIV